jgi:hypothetical protein
VLVAMSGSMKDWTKLNTMDLAELGLYSRMVVLVLIVVSFNM